MHISSRESARSWRRWATISLLSLSAFGSSALAQDTIWSSSTTPGTIDAGDPTTGVNLGVRFQSSVAGTISGIRFYKASDNTGTHVATLYSDAGTQLAQATFSGETSSGWQQVNFTAVSINANTTYVAAYHTTNGHYSDNDNYFTSAYVNSPLTAMADNPSGDRNGVYTYSTSVVFPTSTYEAANYWVDVVFNPTGGGGVPGAPSGLQGLASSATQNDLVWTASTGTVTGYYVYRGGTQVGTAAYTAYTDTGLTANTQYSYYVKAYNGNGSSGNSNTVNVTTLTSASGGLPTLLRTFFPLGPDGQPTSNLSTWASRGANALIRIGGGENFTSWNSTANALGLKYVRSPASPLSADVGNTNLLAWHQDDEPCSGETSASLQSLFAQWKAADITRPVSVNLAPGGMLGLGGCTAAQNQPYIDNTSDWAMNDIYPIAGWDEPGNIVYPNNWVGEALQQMAAISRGRPQMQFVECAEQNLSWCPQCPAPTPQQFHTEFWDAIINGARGVWLFPEAISPFVWDNTTAAMDTQITADWTTVKALVSALQSTINPSGMSATVTAPLEAGWRNSGHQYFIVDNTGPNALNSQTITLTGTGSATQATVYGESRTVPISSGKITDNFAANAVHIYQVN